MKIISMSAVVVSISMSLDGFIADSNISKEWPMGVHGPLLHKWIFDDATKEDEQLLGELVASTGAVILGNRTYSTAIDDAWNSQSPFNAPAFVLCHKQPVRHVSGFHFIEDGIEIALHLAKAVAEEKNVWVMGGASVVQQYLKAGMVDELHIHIAPVLLGHGIRLFNQSVSNPIALIKKQILATKGATHLFFKIEKHPSDCY